MNIINLKYRNIWLLILGLLSVTTIFAQPQDEYGFIPCTDTKVTVNGHFLRDPWAGGLNNVQFGQMDINNDGVTDLLLFDRHGDRLLPFIYHPDGISPGFNYAPEYRHYFPPLKHWFQTADYNNDGFTDIFSYTPGGIMVYRNNGQPIPSFQKAVNPFIRSLQGSILTNLLVTYVDYPAIVDLDMDGDLDILTFWGLGSFVELHQNMSVEQFGNADSLIYHKVNNCWGRFSESDESNVIAFDTCVDFSRHADGSPPKHTGSTFLLTDIDDNDTLDLVLGDVDFSNVIALRNGGSNVEALMVEQIPAWPVSAPVNIWSFPIIQKLDLYNNGTQQMLASSFDPGLLRSQGSESVWLYDDCKQPAEITDENRLRSAEDCGLLTRSFLQDGMIDLGLGAYPVFSDVNQDGLIDLVVGNYGFFDTCILQNNGQLKCYFTGRLHLYLNNGTITEPSFILADDDFGLISQAGLQAVYPALNDLDGDGDTDMLIGDSEGDLWFCRNTAGSGNLPIFDAPIPGYQGIKVEGFSTPAFVDIDENGLTDMVVGSLNGKLTFYKNEGSIAQPIFTKVTDFLGKVNVTDQNSSYTGHSVPCFFRTLAGELRLLAGSESGLLKYYTNITADTNQPFTLKDAHFMYITEGIRTAPAWADLNHDGLPELAVGNYSGGITLFKGISPGPADVEENADDNKAGIFLFPNPGNGQMKITITYPGKWEVTFYSASGALLEKIPVEGLKENFISLGRTYTGLVLLEARNLKNPKQILRSRAMIIR